MQLYTSAQYLVVKVLETFLEAILCMPFQLLRRIFNDHHKSPVPSLLISVQRTGKYQLEQGQESVWEAPLSLHSSLLRNP